MKFVIEIDDTELTKMVAERVADALCWDIKSKSKELLDKMEWKKLAPFVQEAILKAAANKLFER